MSKTENPTHCWCPRSRYNPRWQRPTNPECPEHGHGAAVDE